MSNALGCIYLTNYSLFLLFAVHIHIVDISGYAYLRAQYIMIYTNERIYVNTVALCHVGLNTSYALISIMYLLFP